MNPVYFYVPNIIGYIRVVSGLAAFWFAFDEPWKFFYLYAFSYALDALDGVAARALGQTSAFGAVLDMVTDRFCTMALLMILSHLYKGQHLYMLFVFLAILDVVSHWCAMYRTLYIGAASHKDVSGRHWLLRFYYGFPYALLVLCVTNEACLLLLYLAHHYAGPLVVLPAAILPAFAALPAAVQTLIGFTGTGLPLVWLGVVVNFPFMALKQIISVVQLHEAMDNIADKDVADKASKKK